MEVNKKNVEKLYNLMLDKEDETCCGNQWEELIFNEYDTPLSIVNSFIDTFLDTDFKDYDYDWEGHSIANKEEKKEALVKFLENRKEYIRNR